MMDREAILLDRYPEAAALVESGEASPQLERAVELFLDGKVLREIGVEMALSTSRTQTLLADPIGRNERQRKRAYDGECVDCGGRTVGDGSRPPDRCRECAKRQHMNNAKWQPEVIVAAVQRWHAQFGDIPASTDWNVTLLKTRGRMEAVDRFYAGDWPHTSEVQRRFGQWNEAIRAAGFEPREIPNVSGKGRGPGSLTAQMLEETVALVAELGLADAAKELGLTVPGVQLRMQKAKRKGKTMPTGRRLTPVDVMTRERDRLRGEVEKSEERLAVKRKAIEDYDRAIARLGAPREPRAELRDVA